MLKSDERAKEPLPGLFFIYLFFCFLGSFVCLFVCFVRLFETKGTFKLPWLPEVFPNQPPIGDTEAF